MARVFYLLIVSLLFMSKITNGLSGIGQDCNVENFKYMDLALCEFRLSINYQTGCYVPNYEKFKNDVCYGFFNISMSVFKFPCPGFYRYVF